MKTSSDEYGIHNTGERVIWITYLLIVLLSSLIGDSIILIASIKYNAIKLNKFLVTVMQHIAVCDIFTSVTYVLPTMISLIANKWILGDVIAYIHVYLDTASMVGSNILICALICSKLLLLEFPLHARKWTVTKAHTICACIWFFAFSIPALRLSLDPGALVFDYIEYNVNYGVISKYSKAVNIAIQTISVLAIDIPVAIVIITTCLTLVHLIRSRKVAQRIGGDQRWQGIVTVVAAGTVYCISSIPDRLTFLIFDVIGTPDILQHSYLSRFCESVSTLNIVCNFFIYSLTVPSFKAFLKSKITDVISERLTENSWFCDRESTGGGARDQERRNSGNMCELIQVEVPDRQT